MAPGDIKFDPRRLVFTHYRSFVDARTNDFRWQDFVGPVGAPIAAGVTCFVFNVQLPQAASVGLLTATGILSAFMFGLLTHVADRAMSWEDTAPPPGRATPGFSRAFG